MTKEVSSIVVRLAGDSGDGIQLMGSRFAVSTALSGSDFATFPDYPAEIRAPAGTTFGVSAYQINLGDSPITTPGDTPDVLVAFNPAALKVSLPMLEPGALILVNNSAFTARNLAKAGYAENPLDDPTLSEFRVISADIARLNQEAVDEFGLSKSDSGRCKNFWSLGLLLWMFELPIESVIGWIQTKLAKDPTMRDANIAALKAGHTYGEAQELAAVEQVHVAVAHKQPGRYRTITGAEAMALGFAAAGELADRSILFSSYPITPSSPLLHHLARLGDHGVGTFQAEDEIAAIGAAIGASYGGMIGVTSSSGPGIALKTEAMGLAVSAELPLVIVNWQRGGPSTGLPTKTEQSDLFQAVYGRNGDTPIPVIAAQSAGDCFDAAIDATRIALRHMTPVILLADGYISNAAEPWRIPDLDDYAAIDSNTSFDAALDPQRAAFNRDPETLGRPWITPGIANMAHRIGGIEKDIASGHISYDPDNHQAMTDLRRDKVARVANYLPDQALELGTSDNDVLLVGWGSTYGPLYQAARNSNAAFLHLRYLNPLPKNLASLLEPFKTILVPEMNDGQLSALLRDRLGIKTTPITKVTGQPFKIGELNAIVENARTGA